MKIIGAWNIEFFERAKIKDAKNNRGDLNGKNAQLLIQQTILKISISPIW